MLERTCAPVVALIDEHMRGPQLRSKRTVVAITPPESGVGDHISAFLGALAVAMGTARRLEVLPDTVVAGVTSYIDVGFELPFSARYTGDPRWVSEALEWVRRDYPRLKPNSSTPPMSQQLPQLSRGDWGVTATSDLAALAARLIVPSPSGAYPPLHPRYLTHEHDMLLGGNVGSVIFRAWFERQLHARNGSYSGQAVSCALRHLLRPTRAALDLLGRLRPPLPSRAEPAAVGGEAVPDGHVVPPVVGVHIRAAAHLLNRAAKTEDARYLARSAHDGVFDADRVFPGCARGQPVAPLHLANFSEYWEAAAAISRHLGGTRAGRAASTGGWSRWLVASDSEPLKREAQAAWPGVVYTTPLIPKQVGSSPISLPSRALSRAQPRAQPRAQAG